MSSNPNRPYQLPNWSHKARDGDEWILEEIKNGVIVNRHELDKPVITFGRTPLHLGDANANAMNGKDFKSIITAHESCSRLHARIAFDSTGTPWLRDLGSGNGTTINKKKLPIQSIGKYESSSSSSYNNNNNNNNNSTNKEGSRGVILYPNDVINFGASTRLYVLNGPNYFDRGSVKARKQMRLMKQTQMKETNNDNGDNNNGGGGDADDDDGISWGMNFDDDDHDPSSNSNNIEPNQSSQTISISTSTSSSTSSSITPIPAEPVSEKHRKIYDKIKTKQYKLNNIQTEMKRIQTKGISVQLTNGQQLQLEKNEKQKIVLETEIQKLEDELRSKLDRSSGSGSGDSSMIQGKNKQQLEDENNEDYEIDDFYDRTKATKRSRLNENNNINNVSTKGGEAVEEGEGEVVETIESLTIKWKSLLINLQTQKQCIEKEQIKVNEIRQEITQTKNHNSVGGGNEDCFFLENDLEIANDQYTKMKKNMQGIEEKIQSTERLILIIDDKLKFNRELVFIGHQLNLDKIIANTKEDKEKKKENARTMMMMMPPPSLPLKVSPKAQQNSKYEQREIGFSSMMPPPPPIIKTKQIRGPIMQPPIQVKQTKKYEREQSIEIESSEMTESSNTNTPTNKRKRQGPGSMRPPIIGTLQAIQQASTTNTTDTSTPQIDHISDKSLGSTNVKNKSTKNDFNPKVDQWVAPKEQDGSGRTKLNAKFEGRY